MSAQFGATLRLLRLDSGLSLRDLARRLGVSGAYLSRVEHGVDPTPTPARLEALARELGLPPTLLIDLAHRISPLVVEYVEQTPDAGSLFLEIAHRRLDARQLAELRAILDERFAPARPIEQPPAPSLCSLLTPERLILQVGCSEFDDALDLAAGRLAEGRPGHDGAAIAASLKKRESQVSSAIGGGVAVPVAYLEGALPAAALVTLAPPLEHDTPDGQPLVVAIVVVGPPDDASRPLLLAHVARLAARGLAGRVASVGSPAEAMACLAALEA